MAFPNAAIPTARPVAGDPGPGSAMLVADRLSVTYAGKSGRVPALSEVSLTLGAGEFLSVLGPSGCGKSTLLKVVAGLLTPSGGRVLLDGTEVRGPRPDVGIVFQQPTLLPWRTVLDNVLLPIEALRRDRTAGREKALDMLRLVDLGSFAGSYPGELSGGMQQRVGIARGLVHDPRLLLMDEPFAALDAMTREHMMLELQRIWMSASKSVLFITHSIQEAVFLSDRVLVLSARPGKLVEDLAIDLPRPRTIETLASPTLVEYTNHLRQLFTRLVTFG